MHGIRWLNAFACSVTISLLFSHNSNKNTHTNDKMLDILVALSGKQSVCRKKWNFLCIPSQFQWPCIMCPEQKLAFQAISFFMKSAYAHPLSVSSSFHRLRGKPCRNIITVQLSGIILDYSFTLFIVWTKRMQKNKNEGKKHTRCQITNKLNEKENARSLAHINKLIRIGYDICVYSMW